MEKRMWILTLSFTKIISVQQNKLKKKKLKVELQYDSAITFLS